MCYLTFSPLTPHRFRFRVVLTRDLIVDGKLFLIQKREDKRMFFNLVVLFNLYQLFN